MNTTDTQLIARYQQGDEQALALLIQKHQKELFSYIYYKVMDEELANDFFQDTFIKIIISLKEKKYTEENKFILWAKRIAMNLIIDHYRAKSKHQNISETTFQEDEFSIFDMLQESEDNVEDKLILSQIYADLERILTFLPQNQQEIIKMRFYDNLTFREIADLTKSSINTTLGRMRYALINIRKIIAENDIMLIKQ